MYAIYEGGWSIVPENTKPEDLPSGYQLVNTLPISLVQEVQQKELERINGK